MPYVLCDEGHNQVLGYYTLSAFSVELTDLPHDLTRKLPKYPLVPSMLIGRLAVDQRCHGEGFGAYLLADALKRILNLANEIGIAFVIVDAKNDQAHRFYQRFGFASCLDAPQRLYLPIATAADAIGE
nr:GNAT family N-acetyltransferase [Abyssibacter sp.]